MAQRIRGEMTSQLAEAIALCEKKILILKTAEAHFRLENGDKWYEEELSSWTTHLAEFREHKKVLHMTFSGGNMVGCSCGMYSYPCDFSTAKAERLLRRE